MTPQTHPSFSTDFFTIEAVKTWWFGASCALAFLKIAPLIKHPNPGLTWELIKIAFCELKGGLAKLFLRDDGFWDAPAIGMAIKSEAQMWIDHQKFPRL